jgi:hypothetical protein
MLIAAGLDWRVEKVPATGTRLLPQCDGKKIYERYFLQRDAINNDTEGRILGLELPVYEVLQNDEAFKFFEPLIFAGSCKYETAGRLEMASGCGCSVHAVYADPRCLPEHAQSGIEWWRKCRKRPSQPKHPGIG